MTFSDKKILNILAGTANEYSLFSQYNIHIKKLFIDIYNFKTRVILNMVEQRKERENMTKQKKAMVILAIGAFTSSIYDAAQNLLAYIANDYPTVDYLTVVSLMSVPSMASLIVALLNGPLSMKISKKLLMIIYMVASCVSMFGFALVGANGPFALLMGAAIINGLGSGGRNPLQNTLVSEYIDPEKQASFIALSSALANCGMAVCNFLFGAVGSGDGGANWPYAFYIGAALSIVSLAAVCFLPGTEKVKGEATEKEKKGLNLNGWKPYRVLAMMILLGIFLIGYSAFTLNVSNYIIVEHQLGTAAEAGVASTIMTISGMLIGFSYSIWGKVFKDWTAAAGFIFAIFGLCGMLFLTNSLIGIYLCGFCIGIGLNLVTPFGVAKIMAECPQHIVALAMSVFTGINFLSVFAAPYILNGIGKMLDSGSSGMAIVGIGVFVIGVVLSAVLFGLHKEVQNESIG